jgi:excisionase family DNA binding protein
MYQTPEEVATELKVTRRTIYEWLRTGRLRGVRAGRGWRIQPEEVQRFLHHGAPADEPVNEIANRPVEADPPGRPVPMQQSRPLPREKELERNQAAIELLQSWMAEDEQEPEAVEEEQEFLRALDEDRLSSRKLFPWLE